MKKLVLFAVVLFLYACNARAEESFSLEGLQAEVDKTGGVQLKGIFTKVLSGEPFEELSELPEKLTVYLRREIGKTSAILGQSLMYVLVGAILKTLLPSGGNAEGAAQVIRLFVLLGLLRALVFAQGEAEHAIARLAGMTDALAPLLSSLLTVTGGVRTAALITPLGAFASGVITRALSGGGQALIGVHAALTVGAQLGGIRLSRLRELSASLTKWLICVCLSGFLALANTGGLIAGAHDGAVFKGAKYLTGSLIPIVGSEIAGKMETLASSAALVRSAAGITGLAAIVYVSAGPVIRLLFCAWGLKLISALSETLGAEEASALLDGFSKVINLLCALVSAAACMLMILVGATLAMGARIAR